MRVAQSNIPILTTAEPSNYNFQKLPFELQFSYPLLNLAISTRASLYHSTQLFSKQTKETIHSPKMVRSTSTSVKEKDSYSKSQRFPEDSSPLPASFKSISMTSTPTQPKISTKRPSPTRPTRESKRRATQAASSSLQRQHVSNGDSHSVQMSIESRRDKASRKEPISVRKSDYKWLEPFYGLPGYESCRSNSKDELDLFRVESEWMKGGGSGTSRVRVSGLEKNMSMPQMILRRHKHIIPHPRPRRSDTTSAGQTA